MSSSVLPSFGRPATLEVSGLFSYVRLMQKALSAVARSASCMVAGGCSPAVIAIDLPMRANEKPSANGVDGRHRRSECNWAEVRASWTTFRTGREVCTSEPLSAGVVSTMLPKSARPTACSGSWNYWAVEYHAAHHESALARSGHGRGCVGCPLLRAKRTWTGGVAMSANDPKRTSVDLDQAIVIEITVYGISAFRPALSLWSSHPSTGVRTAELGPIYSFLFQM